ncbi:ATP-dependent nuclease [Butyrivibrio sp. M55]|uniref:ATP-dependent nuclease n=1 Tax=Butyrivibrio sp. M55 TaxID=1855323 RepID=UPI0008E8D5C9|nr:AAA family ATPase [Butyrivibrio sp. M55]SFU57292.1 putative ATP-dependent endonuclease of the OLD family [Butyrivibrio sp. M55]
MVLQHVKAINYRNLDGIEVWLNPSANYIIGENNLGKSNFLHLLEIVCTGKGFSEDDYADENKPIEVEIQIKMESGEIGFFGDNFDPGDESVIHLKYSQSITEAYPSLICIDTDDNISIKMLRKIDFYRYDSTLQPSKELQFDSNKGMGTFVKGIISNYVKANNPSVLNNADVDDIKKYLNEGFSKIRGFKSYGIEASVSHDDTELLTSIFYLSDGERKIEKAGAGIQYTAMASISVLAHIMKLYTTKTVLFEDRLYETDDKRKILPIVIALDEPEVHLHPFLQRTLIKFYKRILDNLDDDFLELLKKLFNIDGISGQLLIVTHSTDAIMDGYQNIVRFYDNQGNTACISGADSAFSISPADEKQLIMRFPDVKEAFYAHVVVLIEGETEYGCVGEFANTLEVDLDEYGICVVNAQGESSIKPLMSLFNHFGIKTIAIYDGDVRGGKTPSEFEFFTTEPCFEFEIIRKLCDAREYQLIKDIVTEIYPRALTEIIDADFIRKPYKKLGLDINSYIPQSIESIPVASPEFYNVVSSWLYSKKGIFVGRIIGKSLIKDLIPDCYKNAILKAKEVAG